MGEVNPGAPAAHDPAAGLSPPVSRALLAIWAREGKWAEIALTGASMAPLIPDGSRLTVRFGRLGLARGDVVLYATESRLIAHRVLRLGRRGARWGFVRTKGDPVRSGEAAWIPVEDVVGRVVAVRRPDGSSVLLNTAAGRLRGKLAAAISGAGASVESAARSRLGVGRALTVTPSLLRMVDPVGRAGSGRRHREAGLLLRPEERFLIASTSLRMAAEDDRRLLRLLGGDVPWPRVLGSAGRLGLTPRLFRNLTRPAFRGLVPATTMATLARGAHASACQMMFQLDAVRTMVPVLREAGVEPVLLKGAALAVTLYDQPALRTMQDIDLLVPEESVTAAVRALEGLGLRAIDSDRGPAFYRSHHHAAPMIGMAGRVIVEIHRGLVPPEGGLRLETREFIRRAVRAGFEGASYLVLSPEDQLLHASLHLSYCDRFVGKLRDLLDLHALVDLNEGRLDWGRLLESARGVEAARSLYSTLDLSRRLLGTGVPAEALNEMARAAGWDPLAERLLRALARASVFAAAPHEGLLPGASARWMCGTLLRRTGWGGRLRALAQLLSEA
ncbi:MAG: nucleotidyltransferase family protein [Acidobacteria bacterium]|nr:nucleotidyltransferase family protein [Acidobacteriota bacterium]